MAALSLSLSACAAAEAAASLAAFSKPPLHRVGRWGGREGLEVADAQLAQERPRHRGHDGLRHRARRGLQVVGGLPVMLTRVGYLMVCECSKLWR